MGSEMPDEIKVFRSEKEYDTYGVDMKTCRGYLVDITGVLYNSSTGTDGVVISGSIDAVKRLYKTGNVRFLSSEISTTREFVVARLAGLGFDIHLNDVITPATAAADYVRKYSLRPLTLMNDGISSYFSEFPSSNPNCVVIMGEAEHVFNYSTVNAAFRALIAMHNPLLITLGNGRSYQRAGGPCIDVGAFAAAMKFSTGCRQTIIGKPCHEYFQAGLDSLGMSKEEVVMIGDDIVSVGGAMNSGLYGILVRTGKFEPVWEIHDTVKPQYIADDLKDAVEELIGPDN